MSDGDSIARLNAALVGRYRIDRELGEGGMATVYLADDLKHERKVALKVLKPELAAVVGAERFLAEIKTTANLQHPHILPLFDSGEADSFLFYVMPYVAGESLRRRLDRESSLPVEDSVQIASDVAEALEYAHRHGVVHRDIKPGNILIQAGRPLIADFGIALAVSAGGRDRLTETGLSVGTPHYMSPEQAMGDQHVGPPTDIYALGCVLYEMLVGEPPFTGSTPQAILGKIISGEPEPVAAQRRTVAQNVNDAVAQALERVPADRFTSAAKFSEALSNHGFRRDTALGSSSAGAESAWNPLAKTMAVIATTMTVAVLWLLLNGEEQSSLPSARFAIQPPEGHKLARGVFSGAAISPDGALVAYLAYDTNIVGESPHFDAVGPGLSLFVRSIDGLESTPIQGTENVQQPFFSPDGLWVGFWQDGMIRKVSVRGGPVVGVAEAPVMWGAAWTTDGDIVFGDGSGLSRVSDLGGDEPESISLSVPGAVLGFPFLLPDETGALVWIGPPEAGDLRQRGVAAEGEVGVVSFRTGEVRALGLSGHSPRLVGSEFLIYQLDAPPLHLIYATRFDVRRQTASPRPVPVEQAQMGAFSASRTGALVLLRSETADSSELVWVDRRGGSTEPVFTDWVAPFNSPRLSPNGLALAVDIGAGGIWTRPLSGRPPVPVARGAVGTMYRPNWFPDGATLLFLQAGAVRVGPADAARPAATVLEDARSIAESFWSPDQRWMIYRTDNVGPGRGDILASEWDRDAQAIELGSTPVELVATPAEEVSPSLSPNGRWLAYVSDESGQREVYVRPFPDVNLTREKVSIDGGVEPVWARSGSELFYRNPRNELVAVPVETGPTFSTGLPAVLFSASGFRMSNLTPQYDAGPADRRFIMIRERGVEGSRLVVVQNFIRELRKRVPR